VGLLTVVFFVSFQVILVVSIEQHRQCREDFEGVATWIIEAG
jgi:hypothetical protein